MKYLQIVLIAFSISMLATSCGSDFGESVDEYIDRNNLETKELDEGVHIIIHEEGTGSKPNPDSYIEVDYKGMLTDGTQFDASPLFRTLLRNVIRGWTIGLQELGTGGSATLIIPPSAAYGSSGSGPIPGGATLIFEVKLLDVDGSSRPTVAEYIAENELDPIPLNSGVFIIHTVEGGVERPTLDNLITVNYKGTLTDGTQFDANDNIRFALDDLINGWKIGIQEMGKGGSATLIIPPTAGYGAHANGTIPPNSALVFYIDLLDFE